MDWPLSFLSLWRVAPALPSLQIRRQLLRLGKVKLQQLRFVDLRANVRTLRAWCVRTALDQRSAALEALGREWNLQRT